MGAAKVLTDFAKENDQRPAVKGGMLDGSAIDAAQVKRLASMPSREQMLAELGAGLQSPLGAFVGALNGMLHDVCRCARRAEDPARRRLIPRRTPDQHAPGYTWEHFRRENYNG